MKYIISESQLGQMILSQLDKMFDVSRVNWTHPYEVDYENGEEYEDPNRIEFYFDDYGDDETFVRWYGKDYWDKDSESYMGYKSNSPLIEVEEPYNSRLNAAFGNKWYKPFKIWFEENFKIPVKSISHEVFDR